MLNCFYWYAGVWLIVLGLYSMNISEFCMPLNAATIVFFVVTIPLSIFLGTLFKNYFKFKICEIDDKPSSKPTIVLFALFVLDVIYARELPLLSVVIYRTSEYGNFNAIPMVHIAIIAFITYYAQKYFYIGICNPKYRKKMFINYLLVMLLLLGYFLRSQIAYNLFMSGIIAIEYLRSKKLIKLKYVIVSIVAIILILYGFGGLGNLRVSGTWDNSTYIDIVGKFTVDFGVIPKQFMWPYLYMISPLTNLNYNIVISSGGFNLVKYLAEFMPETISKRLGIERAWTLLYQPYFTVSTGFCRPYITLGIVGMFIFFCYIMVLILIGLHRSKRIVSNEKVTIYNVTSCMIIFFMFFTNTIFENGTAWVFIISFISLFVSFGVKMGISHTKFVLSSKHNNK